MHITINADEAMAREVTSNRFEAQSFSVICGSVSVRFPTAVVRSNKVSIIFVTVLFERMVGTGGGVGRMCQHRVLHKSLCKNP